MNTRPLQKEAEMLNTSWQGSKARNIRNIHVLIFEQPQECSAVLSSLD